MVLASVGDTAILSSDVLTYESMMVLEASSALPVEIKGI